MIRIDLIALQQTLPLNIFKISTCWASFELCFCLRSWMMDCVMCDH